MVDKGRPFVVAESRPHHCSLIWFHRMVLVLQFQLQLGCGVFDQISIDEQLNPLHYQ